jgi:hypothetical protein
MTRVAYVALAVATVALGLLVHRHGVGLGPAMRDVVGDALWAMMIAWWVGALAPRIQLAVRCAIAYAFCVVIELSQLLQGVALDAVRATALGHLVLGNDFDARDLLAYAIGITGAAIIEFVSRRIRARRTTE